MNNPEVVKKMMDTRRKNETPEVIERKRLDGSINIRKAIAYNTGRKRPEHGDKVRDKSREYWKNNKEEIRDRLASWFEVVSPTGEVIRTNRLQDFCVSRCIPYVTVWNNSKSSNPITKGRAKGWSCKLITLNSRTRS